MEIESLTFEQRWNTKCPFMSHNRSSVLISVGQPHSSPEYGLTDYNDLGFSMHLPWRWMSYLQIRFERRITVHAPLEVFRFIPLVYKFFYVGRSHAALVCVATSRILVNVILKFIEECGIIHDFINMLTASMRDEKLGKLAIWK